MAPRNPFAFLDSESPRNRIYLFLLALLRKQPSGEVTLSLEDLTSVEEGASFHTIPDDKGTSLVLRFARRGAEAYFLTPEDQPSPPATRRTARTTQLAVPPSPELDSSSPPRHAIHDDLDLALREEEMATRMTTAQRQRTQQARAAAGAMPWRTERPQ